MLIRDTQLACDSCGELYPEEPSRRAGYVLRAEAEALGWIARTGRDVCPACKRTPEPESPKPTSEPTKGFPGRLPTPPPQDDFGREYHRLLDATDEDIAEAAAGNMRAPKERDTVKAARVIQQQRVAERRNGE